QYVLSRRDTFDKVVSSKKTAIADFMYKYFAESAENWHKAGSIEEVSEAREANYQLFLSIYMQQDKDGNWSRNKKMWNTDKVGNYTTPKAPGKK
ncbi:hypothetical protein, partial [Niastella yeongjuensis]|uniref:hypothetical protein n=1 Tax=Niastella yeongjuensis TaxID=354355 RepID=UPI0013FD1571